VVVEKQAARRQPGAVGVVARRLGVVKLVARRLVDVAFVAHMVDVAAAVAHIPRRFAEAVRRRAAVEVAVAGVVFVGTACRRFGYIAVEF
jgi:hypothetical protein